MCGGTGKAIARVLAAKTAREERRQAVLQVRRSKARPVLRRR